MSKFLKADVELRSIYELNPELLLENSIDLLILDLDNTLAPYSVDKPTPELINWINSIKKAGIDLFIFSNNYGDRPESFAEALSLGYEKPAKKPSGKKLRQLLKDKGVAPENAAIIGDQIYTDVFCGRLTGVVCILTEPIELKNPLLRLRYWLELPFRSGRYGLTKEGRKNNVKYQENPE